jgi:hypothetical protein
MYESYSIAFSNSAGSDVLQMETTTYTYYMGRTWTLAAADDVRFARVRLEINFLLIFETAPFFCKHPVYIYIYDVEMSGLTRSSI